MKKLSNKFRSEVLTKKGEVKVYYADALSMLCGNIFHPAKWHRNGRHFTLSDKSAYITTFLDLAGYSYKTGNDAPNGGEAGAFIKISKPAVRFIHDFLNGIK